MSAEFHKREKSLMKLGNKYRVRSECWYSRGEAVFCCLDDCVRLQGIAAMVCANGS